MKTVKAKKYIITKQALWKNFKEWYRLEQGKLFVETPESIDNIAPIINYFAQDDDFFKCKNLTTEFNNPSFTKSLLLIGGYGTGKTSIMQTLGKMFAHFQMPMKFHNANAHDLVTEWESIENQGGKHLFFEKNTCKSLYVSDVKKERTASNYGKTEVIRDVLEKRYDKKLITHMDCNYQEMDSQENLADALQEFSRYGNHIYDRIFEMCNIIKFTGKSFRQ